MLKLLLAISVAAAPAGTPVTQQDTTRVPLQMIPGSFQVMQPAQVPAMPRLVDRSEAEARAVLRELRIPLDTVIYLPAPQARPGTVVEQSPREGTPLDRQSRVGIVVAGPAQLRVVVPALRGLSEAAARDTIRRRHLLPGEVSHRPVGGVPAETVVDQKPAGGQAVDPGTRVDIVLAAPAPPPMVVVPPVVGRMEPEAVAILHGAGLQVVAAERVPGLQPTGLVVEQKPAAGATVEAGSVVALAVALLTRVRVPDLSAMDTARAREVLGRVGLMLGLLLPRESDAPGGLVLQQAPAPGSEVDIGSPVDVAFGAGQRVMPPDTGGPPPRDTVHVPDVRRMAAGQARAILESAGLVLSLAGFDTVPAGEAAPGTVLSQDPPPGSLAPPGGAVSVRLALVAAAQAAQPDTAGVAPQGDGGGEGEIPPLLWLAGALGVLGLAGLWRRWRRRKRGGPEPGPEPPRDLRPPPGPDVAARLVEDSPAPDAHVSEEPRQGVSVRFVPHVDAGRPVVLATTSAPDREGGAHE